MAPSYTPYVPQSITVHLGAPDEYAQNVTMPFPEYIKSVASSEIYPTWEPAAIRANVLAIISFALNRVYTEFYPSRGYPFQITASTAYDQKYIHGRSIFENISRLVDEIFNSYIRRKGFVEPLAAKFCNGTTTTCDGLSQWGSQALAEQGLDSMEILRRYYGEDIELVTDAPVMGIQSSYPGYPLRPGMIGENVALIQTMLNRISRNYPAIPKIPTPVSGVFDQATEEAVRVFQEVFDLVPDGIVGSATWYKLVFLYVGVLRLAELASQGQTYYDSFYQAPEQLQEGDRNEGVRLVQYLLSVIAEFYEQIPDVAIDGVFGPETRVAVQALQGLAGLPQTGAVDADTWEAMYRLYAGITDTMAGYTHVIPEGLRPQLDGRGESTLTQYPGAPLTLGSADPRGGEA